jgi:DHA1 family multidrug resistance protein-like MFS transporter
MKSYKNGLLSIGIILIVQLVVTFEMNVVLPLAPIIADLYQIPAYQVPYMNVGFAVFGMFAPVLGYSSDKYGLKNIIIFTLLLFVSGSFLIATVPSIVAYVVGRSLMGLSFFTMLGIGLSYLSLLVKEERLGVVSGLHRIAFGMGVLISPLLGTYLAQQAGFFMIYKVLGLTMLVLIIMIIFLTPNVLIHEEKVTINALKKIVSGKKEKRFMLITFLLSLPAVFFFNYLSVYLNEIGVNPTQIATLYSLVAVGSTSGGIAILFFSDKFGKANMLYRAISLIPFALLLFYVFITNTWVAFVFGFLFGLLFDTATGLLFPVGSMIVKQFTSTFLTILSLTMSFTSVISNIVGPTLYGLGGFMLLILIIAGGIAIASLLVKTTVKQLLD